MGGRAIGVLGTLVITRFLSPTAIGEVSDAAILAMTANWITIWGFGQYTVVKGRGEDAPRSTWHATFSYLVLGVALARPRRAVRRSTDAVVRRTAAPRRSSRAWRSRCSSAGIGAMPERMLTQQMNFRAVGHGARARRVRVHGDRAAARRDAARAAGRSSSRTSCKSIVVRSGSWSRARASRAGATPTQLSWARIKDMLRFGVPLGIQGVAHMASRYWDNLADLALLRHRRRSARTTWPTTSPTFRRCRSASRSRSCCCRRWRSCRRSAAPRALERSTALLSLVIFPLAVGLGLVAYPLIAWILPANDWQEVAPLLTVLACLSVFRPITWVLSRVHGSGVEDRPPDVPRDREGRLHRRRHRRCSRRTASHAAAGAVGLAFGLTAIAGIAMVVRHGPSPTQARARVHPAARGVPRDGGRRVAHASRPAADRRSRTRRST